MWDKEAGLRMGGEEGVFDRFFCCCWLITNMGTILKPEYTSKDMLLHLWAVVA